MWHDGVEDDGVAAIFDEVHYTYNVLNNGTITLTNMAIADSVVGGTVCAKPSLAPAEAFSCYDNTYMVRAL